MHILLDGLQKNKGNRFMKGIQYHRMSTVEITQVSHLTAANMETVIGFCN
jgi:hypothetical protein